MSDKQIDRLRALAAKVTAARQDLADAITQRDAAICEAIDRDGIPPAKVGAATGLHKSSLSRVLWSADITDKV